MKSPARLPLRPRNNRDMTFKDPSYAIKQEKERRRHVRIQQARARANEAARVVRQRTEREKIRLYSKIANEELQKYRKSKLEELAKLESEYQNALNDMGLGHEGLEEQLKYEKWKTEQSKLNREVALVRGEHALSKVNHQNTIKTKLEQEKSNLKKSVKMVEDARAAKVRSKHKIADPSSFIAPGHVIEVDISPSTHRYKQVRFEDQENVSLVRPIKIQDCRPGIEDAIREENEKKVQHLEQRKMARMRGLAALKRAKMTRQALTESFFDDPVNDVSTPVEPTIDVIDGGNESSKESSDSSSSLHANVIRLDPREEDLIDHATVPHHHLSSEKSNHQFVLGNAQAMMTKTSTTLQSKGNDDFVAKVLGGFQPLLNVDDVAVELRVEEVSTLQSSSSSSSHNSQQRLESTSSMDLSEERFLKMPASTDIHSLINVMREDKTRSSNGQLRSYIEKLLSLKREEIANLSVTDSSIDLTTSSSLGSSGHTGSGFVSSTPASILSSDSSSKSSLPKSVRFQIDKDGSYVSHDKDDQQRKQQIMEQTKVSLKKIQVYYDQQRKRIEAELTRRRLSKETSPLSEGPLLSSSSSNDPPLSSSAEEHKPKPKKGFRQILNKSSSSGTTTTGSSVATAELLQRLQRMEMPSLQRPHQSTARPMDELNTSADLIPDLDTASSYHQGSSSST